MQSQRIRCKTLMFNKMIYFVMILDADDIPNVRISARFLIADPYLAGYLPTYGSQH
jgi:hypothetical protein